jgi:hypothetical protein
VLVSCESEDGEDAADAGDSDPAAHRRGVRLVRCRCRITAQYLGFVVNSYSGESLNLVQSARAHLYNQGTREEVASNQIANTGHLNCTALLICCLYRNGTDWYMHAIDEGADGTMARDNVDELQSFLRRMHLDTSRGPPGLPPGAGGAVHKPRPVMGVVVPQGMHAGQSMAVATPDGYQVAVAIPMGAVPGQQLHVSQPDMYTQKDSGAKQY